MNTSAAQHNRFARSSLERPVVVGWRPSRPARSAATIPPTARTTATAPRTAMERVAPPDVGSTHFPSVTAVRYPTSHTES